MRNKELLIGAGTFASLTIVGVVSMCYLLHIYTVPQPLSLFSGDIQEVEQAFISFIAKYQKQYASKNKLLSQFETFKQNYQKVKDHNHPSYQLGINQFSDISDDEWLEIYGKGLKENHKQRLQQWGEDQQEEYKEYDEMGRYHCRHDEELHDYFDYQDYEYIDNKLETCGDHINWVEKGKVSGPKQQSTCGSCWAHSTIASIETLYAIIKNETYPNVTTFSEQQMVDCNFLPNLGCLGGRRQFSFDYATKEGLTTMKNYPYKNKQQECAYNATTDQVFKIDQFKAWERARTVDMEKLVCQGTVSVSIRINQCVKNYKSGIIYDQDKSCGCSFNAGGTNHAVAIVGFGTDKTNTICQKYWLLKNSWGTEWGEGGFFRVCREDKELTFGTCNMRSEPMIALMDDQ